MQGLDGATGMIPVLDGTPGPYEARDALFKAWREDPSSAPDWFELVELLDNYHEIEQQVCAHDMSPETFETWDLEAVKQLAPNLPFVICDDFDPLGGDSVQGALQALLTENGKKTIETMAAIVRAARRLAGKRGWR